MGIPSLLRRNENLGASFGPRSPKASQVHSSGYRHWGEWVFVANAISAEQKEDYVGLGNQIPE
jgi:hypothetical protein